MRRRATQAGISLFELLVALLLFTLLVVALLHLFDSSSKITKSESALSEVQENVRLAAYHLQRNARMVGGSQLPLVVGSDWLAVQIRSNLDGVFSDEFAATFQVMPGSDVLTLRGFFERRPCFVDPSLTADGPLGADVVFTSSGGTIRVRPQVGAGEQELDRFPGVGSGIVLMGQGRYAVAEVISALFETVNLPAVPPRYPEPQRARVLHVGFRGGSVWDRFNPDGGPYRRPDFEVSRVGFLDSYTYFVDPQLRLMRVRGRAEFASVIEPLAMNIGGLQAALGVDADRDGEVERWFVDPRPMDMRHAGRPTLRVTVLGRTPFPVDGWQEPQETFAVEDMEAPAEAPSGELGPRNARWRRMQVEAVLRNLVG